MTQNDTREIESTFLTTEEVIAVLRVNTRTVYRLIRNRDIPAVRVGRQWRFRRSDLEEWLGRNRTIA
jgi:excisionase family DNA binding protein